LAYGYLGVAGVDNIRPVVWRDGAVVLIDQRRLPLEEAYVECTTWQQVAAAICDMTVRGAPALGVTAGMGMALAARSALAEAGGDHVRFRTAVQAASKGLFETRPTAYNLPWALKRDGEHLESRRPVSARGDRGD
jgi:methylthioribose-1-phosphate isomerase